MPRRFSNLALSHWVDELSEADGRAANAAHWEQTADGRRQFCRAERFVGQHAGLTVLERSVREIAEGLAGEPLSLLKEKVNYKLPGGAGFVAHVDTPAYLQYAPSHITAMVAVDAADAANGALEIAPGLWGPREDGVLSDAENDVLRYDMQTCSPGDLVVFSGWTPHRSAANTAAERPRRAIFFTYNLARNGDHRQAYYAAKDEGAHDFDSSRAISFQPDFLGTVVS